MISATHDSNSEHTARSSRRRPGTGDPTGTARRGVFFLAIAAALTGCATPDAALRVSPESGGLPDGHGVTLELFGAQDEPEVHIRSSLIPSLTMIGDLIRTDDGSAEIYLTSVRLFSNWANGWTEGRYEASGRLSLEPVTPEAAAGPYTLGLEDPPELWGIVEGEIRYYDTYYRGDDGIAKVRARVDRLQALADFLRARPDSPTFYPGLRRGGPEQPAFREETRPLLFPELTRRELPEGPVEIGSDISWSVSYTEENFPERLHPLRNSGTMFRDYEEALELFYSFYNLAYVTTALDGAVVRSE